VKSESTQKKQGTMISTVTLCCDVAIELVVINYM